MQVITMSGCSGGVIDEDDEVFIERVDRPIGVNHIDLILNQQLPLGGDVSSCRLELTAERVLNFRKEKDITGINIVDGMLFWTDNFSEPKKINIERCKKGSTSETANYPPHAIYKNSDFDQHTKLIVEGFNPTDLALRLI